MKKSKQSLLSYELELYKNLYEVENIIDIFTDNIESFSDTLKDESTGIKNSALYFASMTTVLQISKQTLKETIYEILLEEE